MPTRLRGGERPSKPRIRAIVPAVIAVGWPIYGLERGDALVPMLPRRIHTHFT